MYDEIPEDGFEAESDRPGDITVSKYLEHLLKNLGEKLENFLPEAFKKDLSIKQLVWCGDPIEEEKEAGADEAKEGENETGK